MNRITERNSVRTGQHPVGLLYPTAVGRRVLFALMFTVSSVLALGSSPLYAQEDSPAAMAAVVNINSADAATLAAQLNGVGQARAEEIVRYRETYGKFETLEELVEVKGVGQSTLDKNRHLITLE